MTEPHEKTGNLSNEAGDGGRYDIAYDEFLLDLIGGTGGVNVKDEQNGADIVVSRSELGKLYNSLGLKKPVLKKIVGAHATVLEYGLNTGNERVVVIDCKTGAKVADQRGTPSRVVFRLSKAYKGELVAVHNHPNSTPFSPVDLHTFGSYAQLRCIAVQGHTGKIYALRKTADVEFNHTEKSLGLILTGIAVNPANKSKTDTEIGEIFVEMIAKTMQWEFIVGGELNG